MEQMTRHRCSFTHNRGDVEEYNGKKIFYSLGNFAFDQYFSRRNNGRTRGQDIMFEKGKVIKLSHNIR
jgi:poly-gamma-glutamate capsule biosynthesis protein CapA/YwtB (metallophosphatase superfamily)